MGAAVTVVVVLLVVIVMVVVAAPENLGKLEVSLGSKGLAPTARGRTSGVTAAAIL